MSGIHAHITKAPEGAILRDCGRIYPAPLFRDGETLVSFDVGGFGHLVRSHQLLSGELASPQQFRHLLRLNTDFDEKKVVRPALMARRRDRNAAQKDGKVQSMPEPRLVGAVRDRDVALIPRIPHEEKRTEREQVAKQFGFHNWVAVREDRTLGFDDSLLRDFCATTPRNTGATRRRQHWNLGDLIVPALDCFADGAIINSRADNLDASNAR